MIQWIIFSEERAGRPRECPNKQSAKGATFALLATMLRGWFRENMEPRSRKKEISFRENFWPGKPSKTVIYGKLTDAKCQQSLTP